jgi:hypothetical protein
MRLCRNICVSSYDSEPGSSESIPPYISSMLSSNLTFVLSFLMVVVDSVVLGALKCCCCYCCCFLASRTVTLLSGFLYSRARYSESEVMNIIEINTSSTVNR